MLGQANAIANIPVKNLGIAQKFYEGTLGLEPVAFEGDEAITYRSGNTTLFVYRSDFAGTNKATTVSWDVGGDVEKEARALKDKGVTFEHYKMEGLKLDGDVHVADGMKVAWFKDPDGNILNLVGN
jgi:catechol 2,3-dioxygenase-like lactoylglutathione lyase family enzyme